MGIKGDMFGWIRSFLTYRHQCVHIKLRPHLEEYGSIVWESQFKKDITSIEKVQQRATKLIIAVND